MQTIAKALNETPGLIIVVCVVVIVAGPAGINKAFDRFFPPASHSETEIAKSLLESHKRLANDITQLRREIERDIDRRAYQTFMLRPSREGRHP